MRPSRRVTPALLAALAFASAVPDANAEGSLGAYTAHAGSELSTYQDTDATTVITPVVFGGVENVLGGWGVDGSFLVDVVSTASADIVATASTRWTEVRVSPALNGHRRFGDADVALRASMSSEPDYLAFSAGTTVSIDLRSKTITPSFSYDFGHDTLGRAGTPFSLFSRPIVRNTFGASVAMVVDKATLFVPTLWTQLEDGDTSKPYRFVPVFDRAHAALVQPGMSAAQIDPLRLDFRPLDQLPTQRARWALDWRLLHRWAASTLRVDQRLYVDTWGLKATTTDARYLADAGDRVRLGGHLRFHAQTGVSFWKLAYVATVTSQGPVVPALRTGAHELGPLYTPTGGLDVRIALDKAGRLALTAASDVAYTRFIDHLFLTDRISFLGSTTFEAELE